MIHLTLLKVVNVLWSVFAPLDGTYPCVCDKCSSLMCMINVAQIILFQVIPKN